jgi:deoxyribonuclease-4
MGTSFRFGTVGSPMNTPKKPGGSVGAIQYSKSIGLDALELGWVQSVRVSVETCAAIRETASGADVAVSVHAPYFINLNANDEEWPKSRQRLMDAAHYGNLAGATDIILSSLPRMCSKSPFLACKAVWMSYGRRGTR